MRRRTAVRPSARTRPRTSTTSTSCGRCSRATPRAVRRIAALGRGDRRAARELRALRGACSVDDRRHARRSSRRTSSSTRRSSKAPAARASASMVRQVIELPLVYRSYSWYSPEQQRISAHYHRQITRALEARDAERAELVMKEHVFEARDLLVAHCAARPRRCSDGRRGGFRSRTARRPRVPARSPASAWSSSACCSPGRSPAGCSATWAPRSSRSRRPGSPIRCASGARRATRAARSGGRCSRATRSA